LDQSIGIDDTNTFQLKQIVGATGLCGLWALEWAWHSAETKLRCAGILGICMPNPSIELRISGFNQVSVKTITWEDKEKLSVYNLVNLLCKPLIF